MIERCHPTAEKGATIKYVLNTRISFFPSNILSFLRKAGREIIQFIT